MSKIILTNNDIKNLFENIFKSNTENILLKHEPDGEEETIDLYTYLNLNLYAWKQRLIEVKSEYKEYGDWVKSLDYSLNQIYGLVETENEEITTSQDIDSVSKHGSINFLVPSNKIQNLEYYILKMRTLYAGKPEKIQNQDGDKLTTYILLGTVEYIGEPTMTPYGEVIECKVGFTISYLNDCISYGDMEFQLSLSGDDLYDEEGNIVDEFGEPTTTKYLTMPIIKSTIQNIFTPDSVPRFQRSNLTGQILKAITFSNTISFYDFNLTLTNQINEIFWGITADRIDGIKQVVKDTNVPVYLRVIISGKNYTYNLVVTGMEKIIDNGQPIITSLSVKTYGKVV
jgi:hypothetical protein